MNFDFPHGEQCPDVVDQIVEEIVGVLLSNLRVFLSLADYAFEGIGGCWPRLPIAFERFDRALLKYTLFLAGSSPDSWLFRNVLDDGLLLQHHAAVDDAAQ